MGYQGDRSMTISTKGLDFGIGMFGYSSCAFGRSGHSFRGCIIYDDAT